ncbi:uncharacterized protein LOC143461643 isoform X1 [Clavelina lepadiformis]|uniref:uncharacterized protein LOC143461643 isoform X1 n=1 Tax=Clavelina lepadiformis TaxID=159417 RepID=UPI0040422A47
MILLEKMSHIIPLLLLVWNIPKGNCNINSWKITLLEHTGDLMYHSVNMLNFGKAINLTNVFKLSSTLPFSILKNEDTYNQTNFFASSYVIQVDVFDENGRDSQSVVRSVILNGLNPTLQVEFISYDDEIDGENAKFKIAGLIKRREINSTLVPDEFVDLSWYYPLPINNLSCYLQLSLDGISTHSFQIQDMRKVLYISDYNYLHDGNLNSRLTYNGLSVEIHGTNSLINIQDIVIISSDEFETTSVKKLPGLPVSGLSCEEAYETVVRLRDYLLYFSKSGIFLISRNSTGNIQKLERSESMCTLHVSASRERCAQNKILFSTNSSKLYTVEFIISQDQLSGDVSLSEVRNEQRVTACLFLTLLESDCQIVAHTFAIQGCDTKWYILIKSSSHQKYYIMEYSAFSQNNWRLLKEFGSHLPSSASNNFTEQMLFDPPQTPVTGISMNLTKISEMTTFDGELFLSGNVLLVFDKKSQILTLVWNGVSDAGTSNTITQLAFSKRQKSFSFVTENGYLWHAMYRGIEGGVFLNKNKKVISEYTNTQINNVLCLMYDSHNSLYALAVTNGSVKRFFIETAVPQKERKILRRRFSCPRLLTKSWQREFVINPPRVWPARPMAFATKSDSNIIDDTFYHNEMTFYNTSDLHAYAIATFMIFQKQRIGEKLWWRSVQRDISSQWYFHNTGVEDYIEYLFVNNLFSENQVYSYLSQYDYQINQKRVSSDCVIPPTIYLDKDKTVRLNITLTPGSNVPLLTSSQLQLFASLSNNDLLDIRITRFYHPIDAIFQVDITGQQLEQNPPGKYLQSVTASLWPWLPGGSYNITPSEDIDLFIKVGCPPALSLEFDRQQSIKILASRGRIDTFECLYDLGDGIPCFTTSEFVTSFYVQDHVSGEQTAFMGNYTLKVVAGGAGYWENIVYYTDEEIRLYNYMPGDSEALQSLVWTVLDTSDVDRMKDNKTDKLIFDSNNPASIVFECRIDSPCGSIPFGTPNPAEFFVVIEASNRGVDSSTNCDFTMRFAIHLIGIELNPKSHLAIMLVTLAIIVTFILTYYQLTDGSGKKLLIKMKWKKSSDLDIDHNYPPLKQLVKQATKSSLVTGLQIPTSGGANRRASLLTQSIYSNEPSRRRKSLAVMADLQRSSVLRNASSIAANQETEPRQDSKNP